jgi:hypothetical protein
MPVEKKSGIWFPAKRYGWGWGPPVAWQGWVVLVGWIAFLLAGLVWFGPMKPLTHAMYALVMVGLLVAVCYAKGESPRWRWGNDGK